MQDGGDHYSHPTKFPDKYSFSNTETVKPWA